MRMHYILIAMAFLLFAGCAKQPEIKPLSELDACTREAGVMPRPEYGFNGVPFEKLDAMRVETACRARLKAHPDDAYAASLLARALTKAGKNDDAFVLLKNACATGDDAGCTLLGSYYYNGIAPAVFDRSRAAELYERACGHGYGNACLNLGKLYLLGHGVPKAPERAEAMIYRECEKGYFKACLHYVNAVHFKKLPSTEEHYRFAARRACEGGLDCSYYKDLAEKKEKGSGDAEIASVIATACKNGSAEACETLGEFYLKGQGVPQDEAGALEHFEQACAAGRTRFACWHAGVMKYNAGEDQKEAVSLMSRACREGENMFACFDLALIYLNRPALAPDKEAANALLRQTCERGNAQSCDLLEHLEAREAAEVH
jgi:TPR repeat protein